MIVNPSQVKKKQDQISYTNVTLEIDTKFDLLSMELREIVNNGCKLNYFLLESKDLNTDARLLITKASEIVANASKAAVTAKLLESLVHQRNDSVLTSVEELTSLTQTYHQRIKDLDTASKNSPLSVDAFTTTADDGDGIGLFVSTDEIVALRSSQTALASQIAKLRDERKQLKERVVSQHATILELRAYSDAILSQSVTDKLLIDKLKLQLEMSAMATTLSAFEERQYDSHLRGSGSSTVDRDFNVSEPCGEPARELLDSDDAIERHLSKHFQQKNPRTVALTAMPRDSRESSSPVRNSSSNSSRGSSSYGGGQRLVKPHDQNAASQVAGGEADFSVNSDSETPPVWWNEVPPAKAGEGKFNDTFKAQQSREPCSSHGSESSIVRHDSESGASQRHWSAGAEQQVRVDESVSTQQQQQQQGTDGGRVSGLPPHDISTSSHCDGADAVDVDAGGELDSSMDLIRNYYSNR